MSQVQRLLALLAAVVLLFIAVKWVVLWRRLNAAAAAARAEARRRVKQAEGVNHRNIDDVNPKD